MPLKLHLPDVGNLGTKWLSDHPVLSASRQPFAFSNMLTVPRSLKSRLVANQIPKSLVSWMNNSKYQAG